MIFIGTVYAYISSKSTAMEKSMEEMSKSGIWIFRGLAGIPFVSG